MSDRRVLLVSPHNIEKLPCFGVLYEFVEVLRSLENATVVAPERSVLSLALSRRLGPEFTSLNDRVSDMARAVMRLPAARRGRRSVLPDRYDLCFFVCQFPKQIAEIGSVVDWRRRSRLACAFILDTWPSRVDALSANYRLLDRFDLVFVLNPAAVPLIQRHTSTPVRFLPTAADMLMLPPDRLSGRRVIDYLCIGRRRADIHAALCTHAERRAQFYHYDVWERNRARDWHAVRRHNADLIARSRSFLVWAPGRGDGEQALSTRYFEGWAGGAAVLGSRPRMQELDGLFDWPDSVIDLPEDPAELDSFLDRLCADPVCLARIGRRNRQEALRRHDWAHRWAAVLGALGLPETTALVARLADLESRAEAEAEAEVVRIDAHLSTQAPRLEPARRFATVRFRRPGSEIGRANGEGTPGVA